MKIPQMIHAVSLGAMIAVLSAPDIRAADKEFALAVPHALAETGLLDFVVPRFSLKTATRITLVDETTGAVARLNQDSEGVAVFSGPNGDWFLDVGTGDGNAAAHRFSDWLTSDIGHNTIVAFQIDGSTPFQPPSKSESIKVLPDLEGDAIAGEKLAELHCGRCHMVNERTRMSTIGSTPSFALLRNFPDWVRRFEGFYALRPHPSFTLVADVTPPFDDQHPSPIEPVRLTLDEIDEILAYVVTIEPADLGRPIDIQ